MIIQNRTQTLMIPAATRTRVFHKLINAPLSDATGYFKLHYARISDFISSVKKTLKHTFNKRVTVPYDLKKKDIVIKPFTKKKKK